ncbi:hypothetical protein F2Q69_00015054 [Brassica cretica]|uniref:Uncharacterized protein n=1 Tax=Brassica cretica TaxID=69181 RepID=A0A8S9QQ84_BRACR|nr:hypothetical protein F2Q69_00015054 [Brassica cretica]
MNKEVFRFSAAKPKENRVGEDAHSSPQRYRQKDYAAVTERDTRQDSRNEHRMKNRHSGRDDPTPDTGKEVQTPTRLDIPRTTETQMRARPIAKSSDQTVTLNRNVSWCPRMLTKWNL